MAIPYYPNVITTPLLGLSLHGMEENVAQNFIILDSAVGSGGGGSSILLQTNGVNNTLQTKENLIAGANITLTADAFGGTTIASTGGGGGSSVKVNGSSITNPNFNDTTPTTAVGGVNVSWQFDGSGNVSAYVPNAAGGPFVRLFPSSNQTITGNFELNIPGLLVPGTAVDGTLNAGPAISTLSTWALSTLLPANEFTANITSILPDPVNSYGALQVGVDSSKTFSNAMNVFLAVNLPADDSSGQDAAAQFFETNVNFNGHTATGGILGVQGNSIANGNGTVAYVLGMFSAPVFQEGSVNSPIAAAYYGFTQLVDGSPVIGICASYYAESARLFGSNSPVISVAAQYYAQPNSGFGTLNSLFYGEDQGTGINDYAVWLGGGKVLIGKSDLSGLQLGGSTSGVVTIRAAAMAGSSNPLVLPTTTGSSGQVLSTDGANPQQLSWVTVSSTPSEVASVHLTAQTASIATTTLYAVPASGVYRISYYLKITTAGSTSGSVTLTLVYTDRDDSVAVTYVVPTPANATDSTSVVSGTLIVDAKTGTNITYATTYASSGGTAMQYKTSLKVETV